MPDTAIRFPFRRASLLLWTALCTLDTGIPPAGAQLSSSSPLEVIVHKGPAVLIHVAGDPVVLPVDETGTAERVANASGELYRDTATGSYWTRVGKRWVGSAEIEGPYGKHRGLPRVLSQLPHPEAGPQLTWRSSDPAPVFVRTRRAVLVTLVGDLALERIGEPGGVHIVSNTDADLFFHGPDARYYLLAGGRWFSTTHVDAEWDPVDVPPATFRQIPRNHPRGYVLAAIPGTPEHAAAVARVTQVTLRRVTENATTTVTYHGAPVFHESAGIPVKYAVNTEQDVFETGGLYYCCAEGMWYLAPAPTGPWSVCTVVPDVLYTLPSSHPKHHVTRVLVYPAEEPGYLVAATNGQYAGWLVVDDRLVHRTWHGRLPSGTIQDGTYYGPNAFGEYLAPHYGNWGRGNWEALQEQLPDTRSKAALRQPTADRWDVREREDRLSAPGRKSSWYGGARELEERRRNNTRTSP